MLNSGGMVQCSPQAGGMHYGQVERMNRTIKDATVKRYFYETHAELREAFGGLRRPLLLSRTA
jgi:hypothetical protein